MPRIGRLAVLALVVAGCGGFQPTAATVQFGTTTPTPATAASEATAAAPSAPGPGTTLATGQTETDWGRIWDELPAAFPVYPGATPAAEAETGPASATFAVQGADARTIATWIKAELERAAYRTEALTGPFEDGSFVLESVGAAGCRVESSVAPLGSLTTISVRYGAACANP